LEGGNRRRHTTQFARALDPVSNVIIVVLAFNFLGDGLRDAADPYK